MADTSNSHEEQGVEQNLKQLQDLGISSVWESLLEVAKREYELLQDNETPKSKKSFESSELRRSSRARIPVSYRDEVADVEIASYRKRNNTNQCAGREYNGRIASYEEQVRATERAEQLQSDLQSCHPSFIKSMIRSHVSSCFWLGLPSKFVKEHLPSDELNMVLEDENGFEHNAIYIGRRTGLSSGWRRFAINHNLEEGDALVFELTEPDRFKVYIIKAIEADSSRDIDSKIADEDIEDVTRATKTGESVLEDQDLSVPTKQQRKLTV